MLLEMHVANQPIRQPAGQPQPFPTERQIGGAVLAPARSTRRRQDLKATVEQERVQIQPVAAKACREHHFSHRLAGPGPDPLQRAEGCTQPDSDTGLGAVEGWHVHRRQLRLQTLQVQRRRLPRAGTGC